MTSEQKLNDQLRFLVTDPPKVNKHYQQVIQSYGAFKCEKGRTVIKNVNLIVIQLYHMALAAARDIDQIFWDRFEFVLSPYMLRLLPAEEYANVIFDTFVYEKDEYVLARCEQIWLKITEPGSFHSPNTNEYEPFPAFEDLATAGGRQWALLTGQNEAIAIGVILDAMERGRGYAGFLNAIGLSQRQLNAVEMVVEIKNLQQILEVALNDKNSPGLIAYKPHGIHEVQGRWQLLMNHANRDDAMVSNYVVTIDDAKYAHVQKAVEFVAQGDPMTINASMPYQEMIEKGFSQDFKK